MAAIGIFARPPLPGKVKTRLAAGVGDQAAARVYRYCLEHTLRLVRGSGFDYRLFLAEGGDDALFAAESPLLQQGENLGERMHRALLALRREFDSAGIIIGTDCLDMDAALLRDAATALRDHDMVIAPAMDGGYVLIGCRQSSPGLFANVDWSTPSVLSQTLNNADLLGKRYRQLATLRDIDTLADLEPYPELLDLIER